nr:probable LRR receptor-like serine/threonine-protein kinase RFK1 isoform X5 [Arachis hypogaea]
MEFRIFFALSIIALSCFRWMRFAESKLPQEEVDALGEITTMMGVTHWEFDGDTCQIKKVTLEPPSEAKSSIGCEYHPEKDNFSHVVRIEFKWYNLPGTLPPQMVKLPYLREIDLSLNYLNGTIPKEWASMKLTTIALMANRLSGEIPKELGNITTLVNLDLEANQLSGHVPSQLGNLINLQRLVLSSNNLSGTLPETFALLHNLTEFRISDNSFSGKIPSFIQNWKLLQRLEMHASGLEGPIPSNISLLSNLTILRISDIDGPSQDFPVLSSMKKMRRLVLRNCNITGEIPSDIWKMENLKMLDVSFNQLVGEIPTIKPAAPMTFIFLTGNKLTGNVPDSILAAGGNVDLSYNNLTWQGPGQSACQDNLNLNLNLFRSSLGTTKLQDVLPCSKTFKCPRCVDGQYNQTGTYTLEQIRAATNDFSPANKIGEGGFGPVYKGQLSDGTWVAVKQLSSKSRQGNREFLNEIAMISCLQHPNLVKLHGFCIENNQLMLVYEYMENNSLAHALFSSENQLKLDWSTRHRICIGIAKGLAFLHEESRLKIVHRDIKSTNVLLDGNLNPKISDFGLARLDEEEETHISTRVAGTVGYMAPEYALWGHLSYKADVYSYGIVVLEIVSGKNNKSYMPSDDCLCLLDKAFHLQSTENIMALVDERLGLEVNPTEAENMLKVALLCTNVSPSLRPTMSEVVNMLEEKTSIPDVVPESFFREDLRFRAIRDIYQHGENQSLSSSKTGSLIGYFVPTSSSVSGNDMHEICSKS